MDEAQLSAIIERAAKEGAIKALEEVGLHDEHAGPDVRELRNLLEAWREAKKAVITTAAKMLTTALLGALAVGFWFQFGGNSK